MTDHRVVCASCGAVPEADAQFCGSCGVPVAARQAAVGEACERCGSRLEPDAVFCGNCGTAFTRQANPGGARCGSCRALLEDDADFCGNCGAAVGRPRPDESGPADATPRVEHVAAETPRPPRGHTTDVHDEHVEASPRSGRVRSEIPPRRVAVVAAALLVAAGIAVTLGILVTGDIKANGASPETTGTTRSRAPASSAIPSSAFATATPGTTDQTQVPESTAIDLAGRLIISADGGTAKSLYSLETGEGDTRLDLIGRIWGDDLALSPDGGRVAFSWTFRQRPEIRVVDTDMIDGPNGSRLAFGTQPAWSPDGAHIAYTHDDSIHITTLDGTTTRLTDGTQPAWSPDGAHIAYVHGGIDTWSPAGDDWGHLYVFAVDGSNRVLVNETLRVLDVDWVGPWPTVEGTTS